MYYTYKKLKISENYEITVRFNSIGDKIFMNDKELLPLNNSYKKSCEIIKNMEGYSAPFILSNSIHQ